MAENLHYRELLQLLNEYQVEYLIVGGYAVMKYTEPRFTKDLDVWVNTSPENAERLFRALAKFGAPLKTDGISPDTFTQDDIVYQIGVTPVRIDVLTHISGVSFREAWQNRVESTFFGLPVYFISMNDLIANKQAAGRSTDLEHLEFIRKETGKKK